MFDKYNESDLLKSAERILKHEFKILNSNFITVFKKDKSQFSNAKNEEYSNTITRRIKGDYKLLDWHSDFYAAYTWNNNIWYKDIKYGDMEGVEVKIPWEFGRMQHLPILAMAYNVTLNEDLLLEFQNQIYDFYSQNPPRFGVQWSSSMDVAIRAVNILVAYDVINQTKELSTEFRQDLIEIIHSHGVHIYNNLEWNDGFRANHYLANLCGLIFISAYLPKSDSTMKWLDFASIELVKEIEHQFNDDGSNFEASLPYHNLSAQFVIHSLAVLNSIGKDITTTKINKIIEFLLNAVPQSNILPQIGDNDSGFLYSFEPNWNPLNVSWVYAFLKETVNYPVSYNHHTQYDVPIRNDYVVYKDFGLVGYFKDQYDLFLHCGDIGQNGKGGHSHNDQLSFVLNVNGNEIITDPGTYLYTSSANYRNKFRSTSNHNTLCVAGHEQNDWFDGSVEELFWLKWNKSKAKIIETSNNLFVGKHSGFVKDHIRTIKLDNNLIEIIDQCDINDEKFISFHFSPDCDVFIEKTVTTVKYRGHEINLKFNSGRIELDDYDYSPSYGIKLQAKRIKVYFNENVISTVIYIK